MAGASFRNWATFSARDMRRMRSSARALRGLDGSRQIGGSWISGARVAAAENGSASSEAVKERRVSPASFFTSNVLNLAAPFRASKETVSGPRRESSLCSTAWVRVVTFRGPPAAARMSKFATVVVDSKVMSNNLSFGSLTCVSTWPIKRVYLPAGRCEMLTVKAFPVISSRKAWA